MNRSERELAEARDFMRQDLDLVLEVVSGDVALSEELHEYMHGPQRGIDLAEFRWIAEDRMNRFYHPNLGPEQGVAAGMVNKNYISIQKHEMSCQQFKLLTQTIFILI